jgi:hypothetical protein
MQQWNKGLRCKTSTSEEGEDIDRIFRKTVELEIEKRIVRSLTGLWEVTGHCGGVSLLRNERRDVQNTALGKDDDGGTPGPACTLSGSHLGRAAIRWEQFESNHRKN